MHLLRQSVVDTAEARAVAERPVDRERRDAERALQLVDEFERLARGAVALVHEREDGDAAAAADVEQLARLRLDALAGVDHHDGRVDRGEHAVGVLAEVVVAGGVEQVDAVVVVVELQHRARDGDAALLLELHPVAGGGALVLAGGDGAGQVQGASVEEELLRERGLAGIRVRDDREGAAGKDDVGGGHGEGAQWYGAQA